MRDWTFQRRGTTAYVYPRPNGMNVDALLKTIMKESGVTGWRWERSAVTKAEEVLGEGKFNLWWERWDRYWRSLLAERASANRRSRSSSRDRSDNRYRPGGTGTAGSGGFGGCGI